MNFETINRCYIKTTTVFRKNRNLIDQSIGDKIVGKSTLIDRTKNNTTPKLMHLKLRYCDESNNVQIQKSLFLVTMAFAFASNSISEGVGPSSSSSGSAVAGFLHAFVI